MKISMSRSPSPFMDIVEQRIKAVDKWAKRYLRKMQESLEIELAKKRQGVGQKGYIKTNITGSGGSKEVTLEATGKYSTVLAREDKDWLLPEADLEREEGSVGKYIQEDLKNDHSSNF